MNTDRELLEAAAGSYMDCARAIEAALKEKNHD